MKYCDLKLRAYSILIGGFFAWFMIAGVANEQLPQTVGAIPKFGVLALLIGIPWLAFLTKAIPRCANCGLGVFSVWEVKRIPILVKSWVGKRCIRCKTEFCTTREQDGGTKR